MAERPNIALSALLVPIDSFTAIDRYFASFVCGTYLLFTAILSINIFIGLISNALQTEAFSTVEARFLLERVEVILNYEWRFSTRKRSQIQEIIHRYCSPLQLQWKDINFDAYGQSREEQQSKAFTAFRQTIDKQNVQLDTLRVQLQQKLNDIDTSLHKIQSSPARHPLAADVPVRKSRSNTPIPSRRPSAHPPVEQLVIPQGVVLSPTINNQSEVMEELARLRELMEEAIIGQTDRANAPGRVLPGSTSSITTSRRSVTIPPTRQLAPVEPHSLFPVQADSHVQTYSQDIGERVTDLQLAVNRLHQDVNAIRQVIERMSPLSASLILGRTVGLK